jgi:hypothetical protein
MQAWFSLSLAAIDLGCALRHDMNGAARLATAAVRKNWRRDQGGGAAGREAGARETKEAVLSFMSAGW